MKKTDKISTNKKRIVHKSKSFAEAEKWDILQHISMTYEERQKAAYELRRHFYGNNNPDVKAAHKRK
jgi:hypothetical protein